MEETPTISGRTRIKLLYQPIHCFSCHLSCHIPDDEDDETVDVMPGLKGRYRYDSSSDEDNPKSTKTEQNPTLINRGAAAAFN